MANTCTTYIRFYSSNREMIDRMLQKFDELYDADETLGNPCGSFRNYVDAFFTQEEADRIDCRGSVTYLQSSTDESGGHYGFYMDTESAWTGRLEIWNAIVKRYYPEVKISYAAEEPGCDYFVCWDETEDGAYNNYDYYIDGYLPIKGSLGDYLDNNSRTGSLEDIIKELRDTLPFNFNSKETADDLHREINKMLGRFSERLINRDIGGYIDDYWFTLSAFEKAAPDDPSYFPPIISEESTEV